MHPLITAWSYYLRLASIQVPYGHYKYLYWITSCLQAKRWIDELERNK